MQLCCLDLERPASYSFQVRQRSFYSHRGWGGGGTWKVSGLESGTFKGSGLKHMVGGLFRVQPGQPCICRRSNCWSLYLKSEENTYFLTNSFGLRRGGFQLQLCCLDVSFLFVSSAAALILLSPGVGWGGANQGSVGPGTWQLIEVC